MAKVSAACSMAVNCAVRVTMHYWAVHYCFRINSLAGPRGFVRLTSYEADWDDDSLSLQASKNSA